MILALRTIAAIQEIGAEKIAIMESIHGTSEM